MSGEGRNYEDDLLRRYKHWAVYLHERQTYLGHTYIALARDGEIDPFMDTTEVERSELRLIVGGLKRCLDTLYQPNLLNYANLRNTWHHCHWHVIPRYETPRIIYGQRFVDESWGRNYVPYPADSQIPPHVFEGIKQDMSAQLAE